MATFIGTVSHGTMRTPELYQYLPLFAKVSIERLDGNPDFRHPAMLDSLLDSYAKTYGAECDDYTRESAHYRASKRFYDFVPGAFNLVAP